MELKEKFTQFKSKISDLLDEQDWIHELRSKWDSLDPEHQIFIRLGLGAAASLTLFIILISSLFTMSNLSSEHDEKSALLKLMNKALNETIGGAAVGGAAPNWNQYFQSKASFSKIDSKSLQIAAKSGGKSDKTMEESLFEITLKHQPLRKVVKYIFEIETGQHPIRIRHINLYKDGPEGYLDAIVSVSAFAFKE